MTREEAVNWLINVTSDIGKVEYRSLWHYEQALCEIKEMLAQSTIEPKKGRWNFVGYQMFECTKCGKSYSQNQFEEMKSLTCDPDFPNFCPNCGSYNGEEQ